MPREIERPTPTASVTASPTSGAKLSPEHMGNFSILVVLVLVVLGAAGIVSHLRKGHSV